MKNTVDLTPTPRILNVLGDIPFSIWQCFAELMDNSFDAFAVAQNCQSPISTPTVKIEWSSSNVPLDARQIVFSDNGPGMDLETLQNAAKAGYSSNDPISNLGLFGMGFNIATARLGDETIFWSTRKEDPNWTGIKIDFDELVRNQSFAAPTLVKEKTNIQESGTIIEIHRLKSGIFADLQRQKSSIKEHLERIYTPILQEHPDFEMFLQGTKLLPRPLCVWDKSRFVTWRGKQVHAIIDVEEDLGDCYFDSEHNRYLSQEEFDNLSSDQQAAIVKRKQRMWGWLGVQRFGSTSDFGIDFIRNGRKILLADKRVFEFEDPEYGIKAVEYPVDLGSTYGGRIVGEIHVDYLIPTYQKNEFLSSGNAWKSTINALRGFSPLQKKIRQLEGFEGENMSALGMLCSAYRRPEAGTANLCVNNDLATRYAKEFFKRNPDYKTDEKWFQAAQEADGTPHVNVDSGIPPSGTPGVPSTNPDDILSNLGDSVATPGSEAGGETKPAVQPPAEKATSSPITSEKDDLLASSKKVESLSFDYSYDHAAGPLKVSVYKITSGDIRENGKRIPCKGFQSGIRIDFFFDESHSILLDYPITPKQLLLVYLAQTFCIRDAGITQLAAFLGLVENNLDDEKINLNLLKERANSILSGLTDSLPELLASHMPDVFAVIKRDSIEEGLFLRRLLEAAPELFTEYQQGGARANEALTFVMPMMIVRLVESFPAVFLDGKVFDQPYESILVQEDPALTADLKRKSLEKVTVYLRDLASLMSGNTALKKEELVRYSNSIDLLQRMYKA